MGSGILVLYKQAYSGLSRNSWYLSLVMLVNRMGAMVLPFMTIYCINELHFTIVEAGTVMTFFGAGAMCGVILGGRINSRIGFFSLQVGSLLCGGILFIVLSYQHNFVVFCMVAFLLSLFNESFRPANSTAIAHFSADENRARSYALNRLATNLGWAAGGAIGGLVASFSYHLLFWLDGLTNILAAILLVKLLPRQRAAGNIQNRKSERISFAAYKDKVFVAFTLLSTFFCICFYEFIIIQPVFYKTKWHFNERFIGGLISLNGILIVAFEMVIVNYLERKTKQLDYIITGVLMVGIGYALYNLFPPGALPAICIIVLISFGEMLSIPFVNTFWIGRTNNTNRGSYVALYSLSWTTAQVIAPGIGSGLINYGGFNLLWWALAGISLVTALGYILIRKFI